MEETQHLEQYPVMLVDDEKGIRTVLGLLLRDAGYTVHTVASGEEALQLFAEKSYPIVITDIKMSGMSGIDLLRHLKALSTDVEVILISGHADLEVAIQGLQLAASDFITKPVNDDMLFVALKRAIERLEMRGKLKAYTANLERLVEEKTAQLVEVERQLAARQAVDGFAFGLKAISSLMTGDQQAFNELPCFIAVHNRFMEIVAVNELYRERLGNLVGHPSWEPYEHSIERGILPVEQAIKEGRGARSEHVLRGRDGTDIPVLVHTAPILNNDGEVELVLELSVDERESRRLREELRVTRERFRQMFNESPCHIAVISNSHQLLEANESYRRTFGFTPGKKCYELFAGGTSPCEDCPMQTTLQTGETKKLEKVVLDREGKPVNMLIWTAPLLDTSGKPSEVIEMALDITELRQLQDRLVSLGLLLGSTAHGIKGMLTALDGTVYRVGSGIAKGDAVRTQDSLKDLRQTVARLRKLVLDILYFSKERSLNIGEIDPLEFAHTIVLTVSDKARDAGVKLSVETRGDPGKLEADGAILHSALINLVENAVDACQGDSKKNHEVTIKICGEQDAVTFRIRDNGIGMSENVRAKLFTLFFSSKGSGGTGIGLYVARQIVTQHGGRIDVESTPGEGSCFTVWLPRVQSRL